MPGSRYTKNPSICHRRPHPGLQNSTDLQLEKHKVDEPYFIYRLMNLPPPTLLLYPLERDAAAFAARSVPQAAKTGQ